MNLLHEVIRPVSGVKLNSGMARHIQHAHNLHDIGHVACLLDIEEAYLTRCLEGETAPSVKLITEIIVLTGLSIARVVQQA